jgi:negative regulator of sigma F NrsF-like protein/sigma-70-like protein
MSGDASACHEFLKAVGVRLRSFLRRRLANLPHEVEDVVQESLLAMHNQRHTYDADQPVTAWVHAIAKSQACGLAAGAMGALAYSLHCPEPAAPFPGFWYLLGMLIPTAVGMALGPRLLRW